MTFTARKEYQCDGQNVDRYCGGVIRKGDRYLKRIVHYGKGTSETFRFCKGCTSLA